MKPKLIIISGSPCVGKTTVAQALYPTYQNSAYLDGDWCWCVNPFSVSDPRLRNGDKNMSFILSTYLNVIFSSVVATDPKIREAILGDIAPARYTTLGFTLTCSEDTLRQRHKRRGDNGDVSFYWLRLPAYPGDHVIHTDGKTIAQLVQEIKHIIDTTDSHP